MTKSKITFLKVIFSITLLSILLYSVSWTDFISEVRSANFFLVILGAMHFFSGIFISALRWHTALRFVNIPITRVEAFLLYLQSAFFNNFLPTSFGGDIYKFFALSRSLPDKRASVFSSIVFERGIGFAALFAVNLIVLPFYVSLVFSTEVFLFLELAIFGIFISLIALFVFRNPILLWLEGKRSNTKIFQKILDFLRVFVNYNDVPLIGRMLFYSFLFILNSTWGYFLFLHAFGIEVNPLYILFVLTIVQIAGILPISFNSFGVFEGLSVLLYGLVGIVSAPILAATFVGRITLVTASGVGGIIYAFSRPSQSN